MTDNQSDDNELDEKLDDQSDNNELDGKLDDWGVTNTQVRKYLKKRSGVVLAETTVRRRACTLQNFAENLEQQGTTVSDAERKHVVNYIEDCVEGGNRKETVRNKRSAVRELYKYLQVHSDQSDEIDVRPIDVEDIRLNKFNYKPDNETIDRGPLSPEETLQLYEAMDNYRNRLMVTVGAETGLRNSDIRELKLDDVDLDEEEITVSDSKNGDTYTVPLTDSLAMELRYWIKVRRDGWPMAEESDYLFPTKKSEKIDTNEGFNSIVKDAAKEAGIQETIGETYLTERQKDVMNTDRDTKEWNKVTTHALRHTFVQLMKESDIPLEARQHALNHKNSETTEEWYEEDDTDYDEIIQELFDFR